MEKKTEKKAMTADEMLSLLERVVRIAEEEKALRSEEERKKEKESVKPKNEDSLCLVLINLDYKSHQFIFVIIDDRSISVLLHAGLIGKWVFDRDVGSVVAGLQPTRIELRTCFRGGMVREY